MSDGDIVTVAMRTYMGGSVRGRSCFRTGIKGKMENIYGPMERCIHPESAAETQNNTHVLTDASHLAGENIPSHQCRRTRGGGGCGEVPG